MKKSKMAMVLLSLIMFSFSGAAESPINQPPEAFLLHPLLQASRH